MDFSLVFLLLSLYFLHTKLNFYKIEFTLLLFQYLFKILQRISQDNSPNPYNSKQAVTDLVLITCLASSPVSLPSSLSLCSSQTDLFLLYEHSRHCPVMGPQYLLFHLPRMLFSSNEICFLIIFNI
jgi:hypothetical protein